MIFQPPMIYRIPPIHRMACPCGMGAMRRMGCPRTPTTTLDAESAEVLENIKALL
jgi:hypothetical protein